MLAEAVTAVAAIGHDPQRHARQAVEQRHGVGQFVGLSRREAKGDGASCGVGRSRAPVLADEGGAVAAELAVALPAVAVVIVLGIGGLLAAATQVRLQDVAADAARIVARGEPEGRAAEVVAEAVRGAASATSWRGDLVCVTATAEPRVAGVPVPIRATSCALGGGL